MFITTGFFVDYRKYQKFAKHIYLASIISLVAVLIIGSERNGAVRWIDFGFITVQPSEFAKIALIIAMSDFLARKERIINQNRNLIMPLFYLGLIIVFMKFQRDMGTAVLLAWVWFAMIFTAGLSIKKISVLILSFAPVVIYFIYSDFYRIKRIIDYINSFFDISSAPFNIKSSLVAFGSGGIFGKGAGQSEMKLLHLPEMHTDFIFPIIGEEYGFMGALIVISLFVWFFQTGISISRKCNNDFGKYMAFAITVIMTVQACINMAMTTGVLPPKGMPLPFISYGGSSMMISMIMTGILFNIARSSKK